MFPTSNFIDGSFFNDIIYTRQDDDPAAPFCFFDHDHQELEFPVLDDLLLFQEEHYQHHQQPSVLKNVNDEGNNNVQQQQQQEHQELEFQVLDDLLLFQEQHCHHHQHQHHEQPLVLKVVNDEENNVQQQQQEHQEHQEPDSQSKIKVRQAKRSSSCKKDRHSKINTAHGPRDRRMRLSLKAAREFFDLQDKLGFDKASKTVEWLLMQAKPEIKKVFGNCNDGSAAASSASDYEAAAVSAVSVPIQRHSCPKDRPKRTRVVRKKTVFFDAVAREESREKARSRARERTREKKEGRVMVEVDANHEHSTMTSTPSFETGTAGSREWQEESEEMSYHSNMILQQLLEEESGTSEELNIDADESLMLMMMHHLYN